jgi:hypothetical protein
VFPDRCCEQGFINMYPEDGLGIRPTGMSGSASFQSARKFCSSRCGVGAPQRREELVSRRSTTSNSTCERMTPRVLPSGEYPEFWIVSEVKAVIW